MVRGDVDGVDAGCLHGVDRLEHALDLWPTNGAQQDLAAGRPNGRVEKASPGATARTTSIRDTTVPKSFDAQRTKAKTLPGSEADDAPATIDDLFGGNSAEPDPVLDPLFEPGELHMSKGRDIAHVRLLVCPEIRARRARGACRRRSVRAGMRRP